MKNVLKLSNGISIDFIGKELVITNKQFKISFDEDGQFISMENVEYISDKEITSTPSIIMDSDYALKIQIAELLQAMGISPSILGYQYLKTGLFLACKDRRYLKSLNTNLYVMLAQEYFDSVSAVERSIRHAIIIAWSRGDKSLLREIFGNTVDVKKDKATNKQFIAGIVEYLTPVQ